MGAEPKPPNSGLREVLAWGAAGLSVACAFAFGYSLGSFRPITERLEQGFSAVFIGLLVIGAIWGLARLIEATDRPFTTPAIILFAGLAGVAFQLPQHNDDPQLSIEGYVKILADQRDDLQILADDVEQCSSSVPSPLNRPLGSLSVAPLSEQAIAEFAGGFLDPSLPAEVADGLEGYSIQHGRRVIGDAAVVATGSEGEFRDVLLDQLGPYLGAYPRSASIQGLGPVTSYVTSESATVAVPRGCYLILVTTDDEPTTRHAAADLLGTPQTAEASQEDPGDVEVASGSSSQPRRTQEEEIEAAAAAFYANLAQLDTAAVCAGMTDQGRLDAELTLGAPEGGCEKAMAGFGRSIRKEKDLAALEPDGVQFLGRTALVAFKTDATSLEMVEEDGNWLVNGLP